MSQNKKPIVFFIPALNGGGAQKVVVNLANALVDLTDHPIHILLVQATGPFLNDVRKEIQIINLNKSRTLFALPAIAKHFKKVAPLAIMSSMYYANIITSFAWRLSGKPGKLVLREASVVRDSGFTTIEGVRMWFYQWLMKISYRHAHLVVANSTETAETLIRHKICEDEKIITLSNPIEVRSILNGSLSQSPSIVDSNNYICAVGRLAHAKGFDVLITAFSKLSDQSLELVILGEGELRSDLESLAKLLNVSERVHLPGFVTNPYHVIANSRLFVLSSRWEGFGNVLVEALATGVPIVSTDCPGVPSYILSNGEFGHLVPPDDPDALALGIEKALINPKSNSQSRKDRSMYFDSEHIAKQYLSQVLLN